MVFLVQATLHLISLEKKKKAASSPLHSSSLYTVWSIQSDSNVGWPYGPFLRDTSLPGFLYCLKYPGFGCLHCAGRSLCVIHESYREQSRRLLMLLNRSRAYFGVFFDRCAKALQVKRTNKHVRIFASLWSFSVDLTFSRAAPRLADYVQYLHIIGQTTLDVLGNIKILARTCPI